jgi:CMP/dCMP kinase
MNLTTGEFRDRCVIVTVAGHIGSGKTEVCRMSAEQTGWPVVSAGAILRRMASERGMSILQMNEYAQRHAEVDLEVDNYIKSLKDSETSMLVDSRLAWHFLPCSFKVYLIVDPAIAAERVFQATRLDEMYPSIESARTDNEERQRVERTRYLALYSVDCGDWRNYDLVVDTSYASPEYVANVTLQRVSYFQAGALSAPECWISPKRLLPTQNIRELASQRAMDVWEEVQRFGFDNCPPIDVGVYEGSCLIIDGHARASAALRKGEAAIHCRLVAFENEEVLPGLTLSRFAKTSTSLSALYDWEDAHNFRFADYPRWLTCNSAEHPSTR